jgi:4-carboxymuconolactone decarboxylase
MTGPMGAEELESLKAHYAEVLGVVPQKIEARFRVSSGLDPEQLRLQEAMRAHCMNPSCFDVKTAQLLGFGMLLMDVWEGARFHAVGARRAGASWEELHAVVAMAGLMRGLTALNFGTDILDQVMQREREVVGQKLG